jgi:predicted lipoprotein
MGESDGWVEDDGIRRSWRRQPNHTSLDEVKARRELIKSRVTSAVYYRNRLYDHSI